MKSRTTTPRVISVCPTPRKKVRTRSPTVRCRAGGAASGGGSATSVALSVVIRPPLLAGRSRVTQRDRPGVGRQIQPPNALDGVAQAIVRRGLFEQLHTVRAVEPPLHCP